MIIDKKALPKEVFGQKATPELLATAVRVYLANQRKASAKTKSRGEVAKTTAKMFKQKGTGNARHGSYAAPIFVGGGIAFGPTRDQNYKLKLSKAMTRKALLGAFAERAEQKKVVVVGETDGATGKTKEAAGLGIKSAVVVVTKEQKNVARAFRNLLGIEVVETNRLHAYHILAKQNLVITDKALEEVKKYVN